MCHIFCCVCVSCLILFWAPLISDREGKSIEGKNVFIVACLGEKSALSVFGCDFAFTMAIYNFWLMETKRQFDGLSIKLKLWSLWRCVWLLPVFVFLDVESFIVPSEVASLIFLLNQPTRKPDDSLNVKIENFTNFRSRENFCLLNHLARRWENCKRKFPTHDGKIS